MGRGAITRARARRGSARVRDTRPHIAAHGTGHAPRLPAAPKPPPAAAAAAAANGCTCATLGAHAPAAAALATDAPTDAPTARVTDSAPATDAVLARASSNIDMDILPVPSPPLP